MGAGRPAGVEQSRCFGAPRTAAGGLRSDEFYGFSQDSENLAPVKRMQVPFEALPS